MRQPGHIRFQRVDVDQNQAREPKIRQGNRDCTSESGPERPAKELRLRSFADAGRSEENQPMSVAANRRCDLAPGIAALEPSGSIGVNVHGLLQKVICRVSSNGSSWPYERKSKRFVNTAGGGCNRDSSCQHLPFQVAANCPDCRGAVNGLTNLVLDQGPEPSKAL